MISIIIPIYNAEKTIRRLLQCIRVQTEKNFEVIMIDDGSTDGTQQICEEFAEFDMRYKYYYQENQGVSVARNYGLQIAKGDYISFVDSDDVIETNYLEELLCACVNADIAVCNVMVKRCEIEDIKFRCYDDVLDQDTAVELLLKRQVINSGPCAKLYKKKVIKDSFFPNIKTYEDLLFNLSAFCNANKIALTSKTSYHYIENADGAMSNMFKSPSLDVVLATERILLFLNKNYGRYDARCFYITISHLFQYVLPMAIGECKWSTNFVLSAKELYKKNFCKIWRCGAIPAKEKVVFSLFVCGLIYTGNKRFVLIKARGD